MQRAPNGNAQVLALYGLVVDPEDPVDPSTGKADIDRFADFMRYLAPPPRATLTRSALAGADVFLQTGCENCHRAIMLTGPLLHDGRAATIDAAIRLHDGEAARVRDRYTRLSPAQQQQLLDFLKSI